ncbi:MAG: DUF2752 domain-containing protein, partial [Actinomycetota bacterium]|nr:DUF2752 domain-containing protein [Actinomycetota bacterium]
MGAGHVAAAAAGCAALAVVGLIDPSRHTLAPPCPLRTLTGLDCPLCGATRATHALLGGDVFRALDHNALYVALLPILVLVVLLWLVRGDAPNWSRRPFATWSLVAAGAMFFVARNVP